MVLKSLAGTWKWHWISCGSFRWPHNCARGRNANNTGLKETFFIKMLLEEWQNCNHSRHAEYFKDYLNPLNLFLLSQSDWTSVSFCQYASDGEMIKHVTCMDSPGCESVPDTRLSSSRWSAGGTEMTSSAQSACCEMILSPSPLSSGCSEMFWTTRRGSSACEETTIIYVPQNVKVWSLVLFTFTHSHKFSILTTESCSV